MQDYGEQVAFLGEWGRFQVLVFSLLCLCMLPNGIVSFCSVFLADTPNHHCVIPEVNLTQEWLNASIPTQVVNGKEVLSSCSRYRLDLIRNFSAQGLDPSRDVNLTELQQESCLDGWSYSKDIYQSTLVTQFNLVCSDQWKQPFTSTVFLLGVLFGSFFSGQVSDRFGRKPVLFGAVALQGLSGLAQIFSPSWTVFVVLFFITGIGRVSSYVSGFILGAEILTRKVRVIFSSLGVCLSFSIGYMLLPLIAYFLRDWKSLLLAICLLSLLYLPLWWQIPESPRWLLSQGRVAEAETILRRAARMNGVQAPASIFQGIQQEEKEDKAEQEGQKQPEEKHHHVLDLVKTSNIRNITLIVCLVWFTLRTGYYGLSFNTSQLHADPYISCFMSAAVEIPANVLMWLTLRYLRRRLTVIAILTLAAAALFFIQLVPQGLPALAVALEMLGKFAVTAGSSLMYVYTSELYPTVLRNTGTGACSVLSRVGSSVAPFLFKLSSYFHYLPYITLGALAVGSAISALFLPETFRKPLPQTIEEMPKRKGFKCLSKSREKHLGVTVLSESPL